MSFKSDVKAIRRNTTGVVFAGRTRLRGIILGAPNATTAGSVVLVNGGTTTTYFQADAPAGDVFAFNIPEDGVLFENGMSISTLTGTATVLLDK
jgi:hypothetical protein